MRGRFIVFEGTDGCGKTTQLHRLAQWLGQDKLGPSLECRDAAGGDLAVAYPGDSLQSINGRSVWVTKEPGATALGRSLRSLLLTTDWGEEPLSAAAELLLYAADRAQHVAAMIQPNLAAGDWVLCDRYCDSTVAYQGYGRGLSLDLIAQLNGVATEGLVSDLTLWLDVPVGVSLDRLRSRGQGDRMESSGVEFHERVYQGFVHCWEAQPERIVRVDGVGDVEAIAARVRQVVVERFGDELVGGND